MNRELNRFSDHSMMSLTSTKFSYDLAESVGPDLVLGDVFSTSELSELASLSLEYRSAEGSAELRHVIAQQHNGHADDVITTAGGMHAINLCSEVLCGRGDHVLVQQPSFPLTQRVLAFNHADLEFLPSRFDNGYQVDVEHLISRLTPHTSLICLATPQNPSGVAIAKQDVLRIIDAMKSHSPNAFLLLDETYRQASYGDGKPIDSLASLDARVISCASLSKCHGAPGVRIGWAITQNDLLRKQLLNGKFQTIICCSALDEAVALRVMEYRESRFQNRATHLARGRELVSRWVTKHADQISWVPPDAGALCCVRLDCAQSDDVLIAQFHDELHQQSARVAPGTWFGDEPDVFRLGFGLLPIDELAHGLEAASHALKRLR